MQPPAGTVAHGQIFREAGGTSAAGVAVVAAVVDSEGLAAAVSAVAVPEVPGNLYSSNFILRRK